MLEFVGWLSEWASMVGREYNTYKVRAWTFPEGEFCGAKGREKARTKFGASSSKQRVLILSRFVFQLCLVRISLLKSQSLHYMLFTIQHTLYSLSLVIKRPPTLSSIFSVDLRSAASSSLPSHITMAPNPLRTSLATLRPAGHRGHSAGAPENTLVAFRQAHALAGPGVVCETDLAVTKDDELILMHDETVDRTTNGKGLVQYMTYAEIAALDAGSWFSEKYAGEKVPRLREALLLARELKIMYQLELKIYDRNDLIFSALAALIDELSCADLLQFSSFDFVQLRAVKAAIPSVPTVGLSHSRLIDPAAVARQANVDAMNIEIYHFPSGEAAQLHEAGVAVFIAVLGRDSLGDLKRYGWDVVEQVVQWVREGLLDQVLSNDVGEAVRIIEKARAMGPFH